MADQQLVHSLYGDIAKIITQAQNTIRSTANSAMVITYWNIGRMISLQGLQGKQRAEYEKKLLTSLSIKLTEQFGKGFDYRNLQYMRKFYTCLPIVNAVRSQLDLLTTSNVSGQILMPKISIELSWTHYRRKMHKQESGICTKRYCLLNRDVAKKLAGLFKNYLALE